METFKALSTSEIAAMKAAIANAEKRTSGELRVFIEDHSEDGPLDRSAFLFKQLRMDKTKLRNGVLIYVAFRDHKFSIIGDVGIHEKVGGDFWNSTKNKMQTHFRTGEFLNALLAGIEEAGEALAKYFPYQVSDKDELSNDIIFGEDKI